MLNRRVYFWEFGLLDDWLLYVGLSIFVLTVNMEPRLSSSTVSCFVARNSIIWRTARDCGGLVRWEHMAVESRETKSDDATWMIVLLGVMWLKQYVPFIALTLRLTRMRR